MRSEHIQERDDLHLIAPADRNRTLSSTNMKSNCTTGLEIAKVAD